MIFAALGAIANRWRGGGDLYSGSLFLRRLTCGVIASASILFHPWPAAPIAFVSCVALSTLSFMVFPHGPGLDGSPWSKPMRMFYMSMIGLFAMLAQSVTEIVYFDNLTGSIALAAGGLMKGPCYLLPRGPTLDHKFIWRELAWGFCFGLGVDVAAWAR